MKKLLALALVLVMVFTLGACSPKTPDVTTPETETPETETPETETPEEEYVPTKDFKVAMVCDSSISDGGWGAACYNAMVTAAVNLGWHHQYTDAIQQADYVNTITSYADSGYDMIFLPGNQYTDATVQVAADYPDVCFALLNGAENIPTDNITAILPDADQIGWMAGALAGLMSESNTIAFIGGTEIDTTMKKMNGFIQGANVVNPDIELVKAFAGSYNDTAKGMELATSMIGEGADVFFGDASAVDSGARQAIDTANGDGDVKIFDIGQPADLLGQNPCVISSVVTDNASMVQLALQSIEDGTFGNAVIYGNLENGCLSVGELNDDLLSEEIQTAYMEYIDQMIAGTFIAE